MFTKDVYDHCFTQTSYPHRGRQSDDENYDEFALPAAHQRKPLHPPPDRVIDFSRVSLKILYFSLMPNKNKNITTSAAKYRNLLVEYALKAT